MQPEQASVSTFALGHGMLCSLFFLVDQCPMTSFKPHAPRAPYRADIDGLRAVAVLLVLFFHAGFNALPGGFIGVDVFFVISGYLITLLIDADLQQGQFSFKRFYQRRIKRLMPALFTVMLTTTALACWVLIPSDLAAFGKSLVFTALSVSNLYFWRENGGYFGGNAQEVPLLHTWSLSVEEQFYLIWPLYLLLAYRWLNRPVFWLITLSGALLSLALSQWVISVTFDAAYYLLPTRMFELMSGAMLALVSARLPRLPVWLTQVASVLGLGLILGSALMLEEGGPFPGWHALPACLGTVLLIGSGHHRLVGVNRWLAYRPVVGIGLISYSLYLWHWPIIVLYRHLGYPLTPVAGLGCIALALVLAYLSWKYIEVPFRRNTDYSFARALQRLYLLPMLICMALAAVLVLTNGLPQRFDAQVVQMDQAINSKPAQLRQGCHSPSRYSQTPPNPDCQLGDLQQPQANALLLGDSHANHYTGFLDELGRTQGWLINDYTLDACVPLFDTNWGHNRHYAQLCRSRNDRAQQLIDELNYRYVILAGQWPKFGYSDKLWVEGQRITAPNAIAQVVQHKLALTLQRIVDAGAQPIILKDNASMGGLSPKCAIRQHLFNSELNCTRPRSQSQQADVFIDDIIANLLPDFPSLRIIDPKQASCDEQYCYSAIEGIPLYLDGNHLNDQGSRLLGRRFTAQQEQEP